MQAELGTTNLLLGVMAVASVVEAIVLIGLVIGGAVLYRRVTRLADELESQHVAPLRAKIDDILADIKAVTAKVNDEADRVDHVIDRVDEAAERVRVNVRERVSHVIGVARGIRAVVLSILGKDRGHRPPAAAES
jgi:outer membrane murein-binding lipoprotein Lpp